MKKKQEGILHSKGPDQGAGSDPGASQLGLLPFAKVEQRRPLELNMQTCSGQVTINETTSAIEFDNEGYHSTPKGWYAEK